jgi:diguanylate cyclase (GGDEF)-like protein
MAKPLSSILNSYLAIGHSDSDNEDLRLKKSSVLLIPLIIGIAAVLWGFIYIAFERYLSASIPLSYGVISALNIWHLAKTKNIAPLLITQLTLVLLLPFFLMWSLGGFAAGSFVFIWAFYAPITALIYQSEQHATRWLGGFIVLTVISATLDPALITNIEAMPILAIELFFILNISVGSVGIFFIIQHFIKEKEKSADAILQKEHNTLLQRTTELKKANEKLQQLAHHDTLTQLTNRSHLSEKLKEYIQFAQRQKQQFAVFFIDLDKFKHINDTYGHPMGDHILIAASERLKKIARAEDIVARFGGDEFVFIIQNSTANDAMPVAKRIIDSFSTPFKIDDIPLHITPSIGIALYPENGQTPAALLKNADTAMYRTKRDGRNNFSYYSVALTVEITRRMHIESMLRHALEREEFSLRFQMQVDTRNNQIYGIEALLRWHQADEGFIPPNVFIPIAEDSGQIYAIGKWVLKQSCQFMQQLLSEGFDINHISVNVSGTQFIHEHFIPDVIRILEETGLHAKHLELELTESVIMNDRPQTLANLHTLSGLGIALSVDDFGTGYSSLSYLKKLPVKTLKIDRSFIRDIHHDDDDKAITRSIIALGKALHLNVIAEGVEESEQLDFLTDEDCTLIQGYFFSKPITADELLVLLKQPQAVLGKRENTLMQLGFV